METPLSSRRITRSQAHATSSRGENEESNNCVLKSRQRTKNQEREKSALIDITNGSPIVGLAMGSIKTPSSMFSNTESKHVTTPGSGESLLRGQVKTLLQKVEEEGVISFEHKSLIHKRFLNSPMAFLAPTPANTPQVYDFSTTNNLGLESFNFAQMLNEVISAPNQEEMKEKDVITRSLLMDFSEKTDGSDSSVWSIQVNASTSDEYNNDDDDEEEDYKDGDDEEVDELCEVMSKISVDNNGAKFNGKHTRFVYNSDGELEGELVVEEEESSESVSGIVSPEGKHLRFGEESEEEGCL